MGFCLEIRLKTKKKKNLNLIKLNPKIKDYYRNLFYIKKFLKKF